MKKGTFIFQVLCLLVSGCDKGPDRMDDYLVEIATLVKEDNTYRFRLDNGRLLIPEEVESLDDSENGQRILLRYVPLQGDSIKVIYAAPIFTASIEPDGYPDRYADDPVKVQSVWIGGDYLNLIVELEYHSRPHSLMLLRDHASSSIDLYISHSRNDDPPGYPQVMYASFLLASLRAESNSPVVPIRLFINTYDGPRVFERELK